MASEGYVVLLNTEFADHGGVYEVEPFGPFRSYEKARAFADAVNRKIARRFPEEAAVSETPHAWIRRLNKTRTEAYELLAVIHGEDWEHGRSDS